MGNVCAGLYALVGVGVACDQWIVGCDHAQEVCALPPKALGDCAGGTSGFHVCPRECAHCGRRRDTVVHTYACCAGFEMCIPCVAPVLPCVVC